MINLLASQMNGGEDPAASQRSRNDKQFDELFTSGSVPTNRSAPLFADRAAVEKYIERVVIGDRSVQIQWIDEQMKEGMPEGLQPNPTVIQWQPTTFRRKRELMQPADGARPIRVEARDKLLGYIAKARDWLDELLSDPTAKIETIALREGLPERSIRSILSLAFLAPDIVKGAVTGTLPRGFGVSRLIDLPANWNTQRVALGLRRAPEESDTASSKTPSDGHFLTR